MKAILLRAAILAAIAVPALAGGPVVLMGIDAEDGGVGGHGPISVYVDVVNSILSTASNGGAGILVLGGGKDNVTPDHVTEFWDEIASQTGVPVTYANGIELLNQSFNGFKMLAVVSDENETSSGGLTQAENDTLGSRFQDFAAFVNNGGGLLGFSSNFPNPVPYLDALGAFTVETNLDYDDITPTAEGLAIGITDDLDVCCWHNHYLTFPDFLKVLAVDATGGGEGPEVAAAIGGQDVTVSVAGRGHFGKKGSVLILPKVEVQWADQNGDGVVDITEVVRDTIIQLENDGPLQVRVKMYFIQGDPQILDGNGVELEPGCIKINFTGTLTPEQPAFWSAYSGAPGIGVPNSPLNRWDELDPSDPPGRADPNGSDRRVLRGYIIIFAVDAAECAIRYNRLSASATIIDYEEVAASEYNAYAFAAGTGVKEGEVVNCKGELNFDGIEFDKAPGKLLLEFYADSTAQLANTALTGSQSVVTTVDTELTLVPLNADLHDCIPTTTLAEYVLHDQNENRRSFTSTHCITCWSSLWLDQIHPIFTRFFLQQDKGKARIDSKAGITFCDTEFDETTTATSLLGVAIKRLTWDGGGVAYAGSSLVIQEEEEGYIWYEPASGGGEVHDGSDKGDRLNRNRP
ncbi:MAG: hypothetical protein CHACPFDD_01653 [Phycisphaerae bacterium]|nr:hypothetical protein [Phycisphaerae bacterium]